MKKKVLVAIMMVMTVLATGCGRETEITQHHWEPRTTEKETTTMKEDLEKTDIKEETKEEKSDLEKVLEAMEAAENGKEFTEEEIKELDELTRNVASQLNELAGYPSEEEHTQADIMEETYEEEYTYDEDDWDAEEFAIHLADGHTIYYEDCLLPERTMGMTFRWYDEEGDYLDDLERSRSGNINITLNDIGEVYMDANGSHFRSMDDPAATSEIYDVLYADFTIDNPTETYYLYTQSDKMFVTINGQEYEGKVLPVLPHAYMSAVDDNVAVNKLSGVVHSGQSDRFIYRVNLPKDLPENAEIILWYLDYFMMPIPYQLQDGTSFATNNIFQEIPYKEAESIEDLRSKYGVHESSFDY